MKALFQENFWETAKRRYQPAQDFLRQIMREEIEEKLKDHQREFSQKLVISHVKEDAAPFDADWAEPKDALEFARADYDCIFHIGALDHANDVVGQLVQSRQNLKPDGVFIAAFLGGESLVELRQAALEADIATYGGASPRVAPMIDLRDATGLLARAGFALPVGDIIQQRVEYADIFAMMHDFRGLGITNPLKDRRKAFSTRAFFSALNALYQAQADAQNGRIFARFEIVFITGYAPSESQPKPLKPGTIKKPFGL